jgi:hypothetical protein
MKLRSLNILPIAAASVLTVLAFTHMASAADQARVNLGPVGPNEPILATIGDNRMIAYYERDGGNCAVSAVMFDASPKGGGRGTMRVRVALHPGELFNFDTVGGQRVVLTCGPNANLLTVLNRGEILTRSAKAGS